MSEISRILTNLGLAYGLGSKDQFIDAISKYAQDKELNDDAIREIIEQIFEEVELTSRRIKAKQVDETIDMENRAKSEKEEAFDAVKENNRLVNLEIEVRALRRSVESLIDQINKK